MNQAVTQETLDLMKTTMNDPLKKSVGIAQGLFGVDVSGPAKNLVPIYTPLRNRIARVSGGFGAATNWKQITALLGSGWNGMPWVPEGQRTAAMSYSTAPKAANYVTVGEEDSYTFEMQSAAQGQGFQNEPAMVATRLLQKLFLKQENTYIGGNASLALGTPSTPSTSASGNTATLPAANYSVIVVGLTQEALSNGSGISTQALLSAGVPTVKTITGRDGNTYTLNGGSSNKSAAATQAVTAGQALFASVAPVAGAVAYAWFVGAAGSETLQAVTTINSVAITAPLASGRQAATAVTGDYSNNAGLAFDGLLTTAMNPLNTAYVKRMATGTAGVGTGLTSSGRGSIVEIDDAMMAMWDAYQLSPTRIYVNSQEMRAIATKVLGNGSSPLLRINGQDGNNTSYAAGNAINLYFNPFMPGGGQMLPIEVHPMLPPGTILLACETLPISYQNSEVGNVAEVKTRRDYYQIDWPLRTRQYEMGVYSEEVLAVYAPFAYGVITNIANV
jgi:hypothetical protein